jgi:DME family drug/metabolite transporter
LSHNTESQPANTRFGLLFIIMTAVLWGTASVAGRGVNEMVTTNGISIAFFRLAFAVPVLLLAGGVVIGRDFWRVEGRSVWLLLLFGTAMAAYQASYFGAVLQLGVTIAVLVALCSATVLVALFSALVLGERLTWRVLTGLVLALGGLVLLVGSPGSSEAQMDDQSINLLGVLLALGAGLSYATVTLCTRKLAERYHPLQSISAAMLLGTLLLLPFALANGLTLTYLLPVWLLLIYLGVIPTALAYLLFVSGMRTTTATVASITTLIEPLTGAVLAWIIFQERLGVWGLVGAALQLIAMALLLWKPKSSA